MQGTMEFWIRRKYNLLPNDPRFLALTPAEIEAEYWAHQYAEKGVPDEIVDENFDDNVENMDALFGTEPDEPSTTEPPVELVVENEFEDVINDQRH